MSKRIHPLLASFLLLGLFSALVPAGTRAGPEAARTGSVAPYNTPYFGDPSFEKLWRRTDQQVAAGQVARSWYWGPSQISGPIYEKFEGGTRLVQYFEKTRMEINNPTGDRNSPYYVTNGLLTSELISGDVQTGANQFEHRQPADTVIAGDPNDVTPTYTSFFSVTNTRASGHNQPNRLGQYATATINRAGQLGEDPSKGNKTETRIVYYDETTKHNVAKIFWDFLNTRGTIVKDGVLLQNQLINDPWYFASGLPISDGYWAKVKVGALFEDVLIQAFERRVLTYRPSLPPTNGFRVEMSNIGQYYVQWRYPDGLPGQAEVYSASGTGGIICRDLESANCSPAAVNSVSSGNAYYNNKVRANSDGTLTARTIANKFRLLENSDLYLKSKTDLSLADTFVLTLGENS
jgi:hypothetical protein